MSSARSWKGQPVPYWMQPPASHREVLARLVAEYDAGVADGTILPLVYPAASLGGALALVFFVFVPPRSIFHNVYSRCAVFLLIQWLHALYIANGRGLNVATSFGVGIIMSFAVLWAAALLIFDDKKARAKRVDRRNSPKNPDEDYMAEYYWQPYPTHSWAARVDWTLDVWTNFRGVGFDFKPSGLPSYPLDVQTQLFPGHTHKDIPVSRTGLERRDEYWPLIRRHLWLVIKGYLICDLLIVLIHRDPYFWGIIDAPGPQWLPLWIRDSPALWLKGYRCFVGMCCIWLGLRTVYSLAPLVCVGLLGPRWLGVRGEPWLYPDHYGTYRNVLERGLAGWWGSWWHQIFRYAFQAAGRWITRNVGVDDHSTVGTLIHVWTAFILSGVLHASGSATQMGPTNPLSGPFLFFCLQPLGIMAEAAWHEVLKRAGLADRLPKPAVYLLNFVWVHTWFLLTAPLLLDDLSRGGLMMIEPVVLSPLRGLGFGVEGDSFVCWEGPTFRWHTGRGWLRSGIAL